MERLKTQKLLSWRKKFLRLQISRNRRHGTPRRGATEGSTRDNQEVEGTRGKAWARSIFCESKLLIVVLEATKTSHSLSFGTTLFGNFYSVLDSLVENYFLGLAELISWKICLLTKFMFHSFLSNFWLCVEYITIYSFANQGCSVWALSG